MSRRTKASAVHDLLETPIEFLKGVGPARAELLRTELNVHTFGDLLHYYPFRHVDRSRFYSVREVDPNAALVQVKGRFVRMDSFGSARTTRLTGLFQDDSGGTLEVVWFRSIVWIRQHIKLQTEYVLFGKPTFFKGQLQMTHPEIEPMESFANPIKGGLEGVYNTTEKLKARKIDSRALRKLIQELVERVIPAVQESLPRQLIQRLGFCTRDVALREIHFPQSLELLSIAQKTLKFEELFYLQLRLLGMKAKRKATSPGWVFSEVGDRFNQFYKHHLPFSLTEAQKRVIREIRKDMGSGKQMNRLLQGDVGSGKTIVALLCALIALDNGFQAAVMAPTEILAQQHFHTISALLEKTGTRVALLTGSSKTSSRKPMLRDLADGTLDIIIGTHALLEDKVMFKNLGFVVIDEQHRFGVAQRSKLWKKNSTPPHVLVMTATPIPRTLAMTVYGDLDVSVIDELPPGRKDVKTMHRTDANRLQVFGFMREQIKLGRQVYVVYPLIEESETLDYKDLMDGYESICRAFPRPAYQVSIVHGRMTSEAKDFEMNRFVKGECQIMVATTVIEVGVNVPNASVMVIESAERFGLSQLHQLRGRVGRGADQSFCILMTGHKVSSEARQRIETLCETNDGFRISEVDLKLRGPGDLMGTQQSGVIQFSIADIVRDAELVHSARTEAESLLHLDPTLELPEHAPVRRKLVALKKKLPEWAKIS